MSGGCGDERRRFGDERANRRFDEARRVRSECATVAMNKQCDTMRVEQKKNGGCARKQATPLIGQAAVDRRRSSTLFARARARGQRRRRCRRHRRRRHHRRRRRRRLRSPTPPPSLPHAKQKATTPVERPTAKQISARPQHSTSPAAPTDQTGDGGCIRSMSALALLLTSTNAVDLRDCRRRRRCRRLQVDFRANKKSRLLPEIEPNAVAAAAAASAVFERSTASANCNDGARRVDKLSDDDATDVIL